MLTFGLTVRGTTRIVLPWKHVSGRSRHVDRKHGQGQLTLAKRAVDALEPEDKPWIAGSRDGKLTGFGVGAHAAGAKAFVVNSRAGKGGRRRPTTSAWWSGGSPRTLKS